MQKIILLSFYCAAINSWAATLGVPNISINKSTTTPYFVNSSQSSSTDAAAEKSVQQQITNFSAQIRGAIIQSKYFQVVDVDDSVAKISYALAAEPLTPGARAESATEPESAIINESAAPAMSKFSTVDASSLPDYLLIGTVAAINAGENVNQIIDTDKFSIIYSIDIAVDYNLVRTKDKVLVASFTAAGHAGDVKLSKDPAMQKIIHNVPQLVKQVGTNLAEEVMNQLALQLNNGKIIRSDSESAPKISDVKIYKN